MDTIVARGRILWDSVYQPYEDKLHDKLSSYHPDFMCECPTQFSVFSLSSSALPFRGL